MVRTRSAVARESRTGAAAAAAVAKTASPTAPAGRWRAISALAGAEPPAELIAAPAAAGRAGALLAPAHRAVPAPGSGTATGRGRGAGRDRAQAPCRRVGRGPGREPWAGSAHAEPRRRGAARGGRAE